MRPRTAVLSCAGVLALLYPLLFTQKKFVLSFFPGMEGILGFFWIVEPLLLALLLLAASAAIRQKVFQYACIITASCFLTFAAAEMYFKLPSGEPQILALSSRLPDNADANSGQIAFSSAPWTSPDPVLGYGAKGKMRIAKRGVKGDQVLYDVQYSIDEEGRRITPDRGDRANAAVLLFGCSFTFGVGLNDRETFAWRLGEMLGDKFQVFNYGFSGYGAHQMLALVESGRLDALAQRYSQIYAFFLTISDHPVRCINNRPFQSGPCYLLENGAVRKADKFDDTLDKLFLQSRAYARAKDAYARRPAYDGALDLHVAIIKQSARELNVLLHAPFCTLIWPNFARVEPMLQDHGIPTLSLAGAMPDFESAHEKYIIKGDGHPNALANELIAKTLADHILKHEREAEKPQ
jgi:lysophospholipase L1-like esterase